jgi:hypothetical protein
MCILMKGGSMNTFFKKILMILAGKKSIMAKRYNIQPETYCEMVRREKREEEMRAAEKKSPTAPLNHTWEMKQTRGAAGPKDGPPILSS